MKLIVHLGGVVGRTKCLVLKYMRRNLMNKYIDIRMESLIIQVKV